MGGSECLNRRQRDQNVTQATEEFDKEYGAHRAEARSRDRTNHQEGQAGAPLWAILSPGLPTHKFEEPAFLATFQLLLIEKSQILFFKLLKKIVPLNALQGFFATVARKIDAD
jgi:hypothetical protein